MKTRISHVAATAAILLIGMLIGYGCGQSDSQGDSGLEAREAAARAEKQPKVRRFGQVIGLKPEMKDKYVKMHADTWPSVLEQIKKSNIRNYSIYMTELEGKLYLFAYYEYTGDDFKADMAKMAEDPETQRWWTETDPCQIRLPGTPEGEQWLKIKEVFHTD